MFGLDELIDSPDARVRSMPGEPQADAMGSPAARMYWAQSLETLRAKRGWTDTELGKAVRINPSRLLQCMTGRRVPSPAARIRILVGLGFPITRDRLLSVLPDEIRVAVRDAELNADFIRTALVDEFLDQLDDEPLAVAPFLRGLHEIAGRDLPAFAAFLFLGLEDLEAVLAGHRRLPFRAKRAITERFGGAELGELILRLSNL